VNRDIYLDNKDACFTIYRLDEMHNDSRLKIESNHSNLPGDTNIICVDEYHERVSLTYEDSRPAVVYCKSPVRILIRGKLIEDINKGVDFYIPGVGGWVKKTIINGVPMALIIFVVWMGFINFTATATVSESELKLLGVNFEQLENPLIVSSSTDYHGESRCLFNRAIQTALVDLDETLLFKVKKPIDLLNHIKSDKRCCVKTKRIIDTLINQLGE
jgi:hypothetical protein